MSDLIKKIKIKKQDGTYTDYIPIGAEAKNVDCSDGESVEYKLNKKPYYYNSVADMKADTNLKVGDMTITLGYYEPNDGGGAEYKIVKTSDKYIEELENSLKAELIIKDNIINITQVGNDINVALNLDINKIVFTKDNYNIDDTIIINKQIELDFNESIITYSGNSYLFDIQTFYNIKPIIKNGIFNGTTENTFINCKRGQWGNSFDLINSTINKFGVIFDCEENFNNLFSNLKINSNGVFKFTGSNMSNAIIFDKCYIKTYNANTDIYPNYRMILTNVRNMEFNNCCFEQCKTLINNTSCNYITMIGCEFEAMDYIAKDSAGFNNLSGNVMIVGSTQMFESDTIFTRPLTLLTSNRYFSTESDETQLRGVLRSKSNLKEVYSNVYATDVSKYSPLYSISDSKMNFYIPINILKNESTTATTYLLTSVASILNNQDNESFLFTIYNYVIGSDEDYQIWKSEWIELDKNTFINLSREKLVDTTSSGSSLENNTVTDSFTVRNYQVTNSKTTAKIHTIIRFANIGNKIE